MVVENPTLETGSSRKSAASFRSKIRKPDFPCVGAKSALANDRVEIIGARSLTSGWNDVEIHEALLDWARGDFGPDEFRSLAVIFEGPHDLSEAEFEQAMWQRLQSFADKDAWRGQKLDTAVDPDPSQPDFSLSFGEEAFFVVGLHPNASRPARRFDNPILVFNLHAQFEWLRAEGRYERMRAAILERDRQLAGDINPMLARHGESSEARQYSGRLVDEDWKCPFRDPRA